MQTTKRVVAGIFLILIALGLALQNYLPQNIDWWATSWLLCALLIAIYGFANKSLVVGCAGVGLTLGAADHWLHWLSLDTWSLALIGGLFGLGLHLIITKRPVRDWQGETAYQHAGASTSFDTIMSSATHYLTGDTALVNGDVIMGNVTLYFDQEVTTPVQINSDVVMGNLRIFVPADWTVVAHTDNILGSTTIAPGRPATGQTPQLIIKGDVIMGSIVVKRN